MSRSNPTENGTPNPALRWFEWNGEAGTVRYYDKDQKKRVEVGSDFTFMLLDQLGSVRGWHEQSKSGIYSNEVRDTRQDVLVVRAFKGGTLVEGLYRDIKDRANSLGGQFVTNCYIAFKSGDVLVIGSLRFKGAALGAWMEFTKAHRTDLYTKAVRIKGFTEGKKGRITYRMPVLSVAEVSADTNAVALKLDAVVQTFLKSYLNKPKRAQADVEQGHDEEADTSNFEDDRTAPPITDDDIPF